jgi:succinate dehydrogenase / fumarate reductase iron-sulfur subunit
VKAEIKILRWDSQSAMKPRYRTYTVPFSRGDKVLGGLLYIYEHLDPCLSFRFNCKGRHCGECSMMINGKPGLSCAVPISKELTLGPLKNLPVVKDLVIDRGRVYRSIAERLPSIDGRAGAGREGKGLRAVPMDVVDRVVRLDDCIQCLCCMAVCPAYKKEPEIFLGPMGLLALAVGSEQTRGIDVSEKASLCVDCGRCEKVCPRRIPLHSEAIADLKGNGRK